MDGRPPGRAARRPAGEQRVRALTAFAEGDASQGFALLDPCIDDFLAAGDHERAAAAFFGLIYAQLSGGTRQAHAIDVGYRQLPRIDASARLLPASIVLMASELGCAARYDEAEAMLGSVLSMRLPAVDPLGQGYLASARALFMDHPRGRTRQALATIEWVIGLFERHERHDDLAYVLALHVYRGILLNHLGRYDETLAELDALVAVALRRGVRGAAERALVKLRAVALAGLERWDELEALLALGEPVDDMLGSSYGIRLRSPAARLAAHRGDRDAVARHAGLVMEYVEAFGFSFDTPVWICDIAVAAWQVGLAGEARRLMGEVLAGAERAESPWARARGLLLRSVVDRDEGAADAALAGALALTGEWGFEEIWTRRDRAIAAAPLARAIARGLGPEGLAGRLAARAGAEVLEACADQLRSAPPAARARLLVALDDAGVDDPEVRERLRPRGARAAAPPVGAAAPVTRPPLRIAGLGGFSVRRGDEGIPVSAFGRERARAVLAALVCAGGPVHREQLLEWLWPDLDVERGLRALHVTVHGLRRALEPELGRGGAGRSVVRAEGEGYRLVPRDGDGTDVDAFLALARAPGGEDDAARVRRLAAAERAYTGPLYPEWPYAEWAADRRRDLERVFSAVLAELADAHLAAGRHRDALLRYERLVQLEPEREAAHRSLMLAYARAGEKALALRQYHACRSTLRRELGVEASAETRALYRRILEERPVTDPAAAAAV